MTHPPTIMLLLVTLLLSTTAATATMNRRLLHQPFFQLDQPVPSISLPPSPSPQPQPKYPFSTLSPPTATTTPQNPFFPSYPYSPPPPVPPSATATTFPANISSIVLPSSSSPHSFHRTIKLISLVLSLSVFSFLLLAALIFLLFRHHRRPLKADTVHLFPANIPPSDASKNPPPPTFPRHKPACTSSEFLYLGTLVSSRDADNVAAAATQKDKEAPPAVSYLRLGSPDLHPLPPLPRQHSQQIYDTKILNSPINKNDDRSEGNGEEENEEFFSPRWSTVNVAGPYSTTLSPALTTDFVNGRSLNSSNSCSPSVVLNYSGSLKTTELSSPDSLSDFPAPLPRFTIPPPPTRDQIAFSTFSPSSTEDCSSRASDFSDAWKVPPPAPSPPLARVWETAPAGGPPELVGPSRKAVNRGKGSFGNSGDIGKPKLKPLDKVRASTDRTRVWDHFKFSSIQLNEEMIETLFTVSSPTKSAKVGAGRQIIPDVNQECLVLGPKKSQNIAILLRALNVTIEEVCEALAEGNADTLGNELLESLLKMAPTKDEERKLKDFKDDTPTFLLGTAETFLKAVIDIPFAFQRVDAMLYIANFDSEVEYLKRCFSTLGCACKELKSSRIFLKLLEAALRIGNQMNVGINEGDVQAFKLDSLVKLVDIKGTDGKTTLLHFVVQEIISTEGSCLSQSQQSTLRDEVEFRKVGLQVVSGLNGELTNVKKAATMDADLLTKDVSKLATGVTRITQVLKLNEEVLSVTDKSRKFADSMNEFLNKAEGEIVNIQAQEGIALSMVKGLTEYFHGDSNKEEAHPFRLFVVVRDFLRILDQVCKDVAKINERTMVRSGRQIEATAIPVVSQVFSS